MEQSLLKLKRTFSSKRNNGGDTPTKFVRTENQAANGSNIGETKIKMKEISKTITIDNLTTHNQPTMSTTNDTTTGKKVCSNIVDNEYKMTITDTIVSCGKEIERQIEGILKDKQAERGTVRESKILRKKWSKRRQSGNFRMKKTVQLSFDDVHQVLLNTRDQKEQSIMFFIRNHKLYVSLYMNHVDELYELLSIRNTNGETALHVNARWITDLLADTYRPKLRDNFIKLTSIKSNNNKTALQVTNYEILRLLIPRVENNEYITHGYWHTKIIIIYNTHCGSKNRSGAEEEARIIHNACKCGYNKGNVTLKKNKTAKQIIELIKHTANRGTNSARGTWSEELTSSLIVILMSHGSVGTLDDCDGNPIRLSDIEEAMCSDILDGRPKMLITQGCQNTTEEVDKRLQPYAPTHDDFCAVMSSVPGQNSKRGLFSGKLAEQITNSGMYENVSKLVNSISKDMEKEGHSQTPIIMSTLTGQLSPSDVWWMPKDYRVKYDSNWGVHMFGSDEDWFEEINY